MTILTHHSNEAWDVFLTLPSHRQTTARKCNSVLVNSPGWRYNNEHKKAKVTLGILLPVYTLTGKIKWKTTSTLSESYKYTHLPEFDQMVLQPKNRIEGRRQKKGKTPQSNYRHPVDPGYTYFPLCLGWLVLCWFWRVVCDQQQQHHLGASEKPVNLNGIRSHHEATENTPSYGCCQQLSAKCSDLIPVEGRSRTAMAKTVHLGLLLPYQTSSDHQWTC